MNTAGRILILVFLLSLTLAPRVHADAMQLWTDNGVAVADLAAAQIYPQIAGDGYGGAIIAWMDYRNGGSRGYDIYSQRVDAGGNPQWTTNGVAVCDTTGDQYEPQLVSDGLGGAIIIWEDHRNGYPDYDVYAQRVDAGGNPLWTTNGVAIGADSSFQIYPQIVTDGCGGAIIAWEDHRNSDSSGADIYAQHIDAWGNALWPANGIIVCDTTDNQNAPQLAADGFGGAIVAWPDRREGHPNYDICAQRLDADGNPLWAHNGVVASSDTNYQYDPRLVADGGGGAIIAWEDYRGSAFDIYAQHVDGGGNLLWGSSGAVICDAIYDQYNLQLVADGGGGVIIAWEDIRGSAWDIYAQRVNAGGNSLWPPNGMAVCGAPGGQENLKLAEDGSGGAVIIWEDSRDGYADIYAQSVDPEGNVRWTSDGVAICDTTWDQHYAQMVGDGAGGAIITWRDERDDFSGDIFAQQVLEPEPYIAGITDVPQDQGREVAVLWYRSGIDDQYYQLITEYSIWRAFPFGAKLEPKSREWDGKLRKEAEETVYRKIVREDSDGESKMEFWELIGTQGAHTLDGYSYIAPTLYDSSASNPGFFSFFVSAHTSDSGVYYDSEPASGYSVDNIDPAKTQIGIMVSGSSKGPVNTVWLSWDQVTLGVDGSPEQGSVDYKVYCDESFDFTPGPGNLVTTVSGLSYPHTDSRIGDPSANLFYLVTAVDGSGNESAVSNVVGEFDRNLSDAK
jgi:hypothetical protein